MTSEVDAFYSSDPLREWQRPDTPFSRIEFVSALRLIENYLPGTGVVCDIGGGPGRYTIELLKRGLRVVLVDLSESLVRFAERKLAEMSLHADQTLVADARNLSSFEPASFDAVLLMGPMYHLVGPGDRRRVLQNVHRMLKPAARALVTYLNSWGLIRTGVVDFPKRYRDIHWLRGMLTGDSLLRSDDQALWYWTTPEAAAEELRVSGFHVVTYAGAEGFAGGMMPLVERLAAEDPVVYQNVVRVAAESSESPQYRDCTEHIHFVVQKG
jgi:SAM-dependent methyltransferase